MCGVRRQNEAYLPPGTMKKVKFSKAYCEIKIREYSIKIKPIVLDNEKECIVLGQKSTNWLLQSEMVTNSMKEAKITRDRRGRKILKEWMIEDAGNQGTEQGVAEGKRDRVEVRMDSVSAINKEREEPNQQSSQGESDEEENTETDEESEQTEGENENETMGNNQKLEKDGNIETEAISMERETNNDNDKGNKEPQSRQEIEPETGQSQYD